MTESFEWATDASAIAFISAEGVRTKFSVIKVNESVGTRRSWLRLFFSAAAVVHRQLSCSRCSVWVFEAVNKLDLQSARWDNICSAVSSEPTPMHMRVCLFSSRRLTSRLSQWKLSIWQLFLNSLFSFGIILKTAVAAAFTALRLCCVSFLVCLRNWNRPLQLFWPEFTFFTDGWTSNEMGTCQCVEMSEW